MTEFNPRRLEALGSWGQREGISRVEVVADGPQRDAIASWRRRGEKTLNVQIYSDGVWRTAGAITRYQEEHCMELMRQITRLLPDLRLRIGYVREADIRFQVAEQ